MSYDLEEAWGSGGDVKTAGDGRGDFGGGVDGGDVWGDVNHGDGDDWYVSCFFASHFCLLAVSNFKCIVQAVGELQCFFQYFGELRTIVSYRSVPLLVVLTAYYLWAADAGGGYEL